MDYNIVLELCRKKKRKYIFLSVFYIQSFLLIDMHIQANPATSNIVLSALQVLAKKLLCPVSQPRGPCEAILEQCCLCSPGTVLSPELGKLVCSAPHQTGLISDLAAILILT